MHPSCRLFADHLRYSQLYAFDLALNHLDTVYQFTCDGHQIVSEASDERQLLVAERGALLFVFNFSPSQDYDDLKVRCIIAALLIVLRLCLTPSTQ
jgi:1,4-alpha-glucan branching enzyme